MALSLSQFPLPSSSSYLPNSSKFGNPNTALRFKPLPNSTKFVISTSPISTNNRFITTTTRSTGGDRGVGNGDNTIVSESESQTVSASEQTPPSEPPAQTENSISELGSEIKKAMAERQQQQGEPNFWAGVADEIREIEWPSFDKVLGTTGVVLGVIAGSSVVLLTVNAVLAELSDRVFAGKGVQDFFG